MKFFCGNCRAKLEVDDSAAGATVECPNCGATLVAPTIDRKPPPQASAPKVEPPRQGIRTAEVEDDLDQEMTISQFMSRRGIQGGMDLNDDGTDIRSEPEPIQDGGPDLRSELMQSAKGKRYAVGDMVAKGGMGGILKVRDLNIRRQIAMKVMLDGEMAEDEDVVRFVEEAQITGQLEHPNITPVHELGVDATGNVFFTMKLIKGRSLSEILEDIRKGEPKTVAEFPLTHLINVFLKICDAVAFAHSKGVVHRDLKPENVMVGEFGEVLVIDWGIAKILDREQAPKESGNRRREKRKLHEVKIDTVESTRHENATQRTMVGSIVGTAHFMAPEQAYGHVEDINERSDIYALGGILYNVLTLHQPIEGDDVKKVLMKVVNGEITDPVNYNPSGKRAGRELLKANAVDLRHCPAGRIPDALSAVAMKALSSEQSDRYHTVQALQSDIEKWQTGFATEAEEAGFWRQLRLMVKRHKPEFAMATAALLVIVAVIALAFVRIRNEMKQAETAGDQAKEALVALKSTAPSLYGLALSKVDNEELTEALKNVEYAINLAPEEAIYHELRGNLLQTQGTWQEAKDAYAKAMTLGAGAVAKANRELCAEMQLNSREGMTPALWSQLAQELRDQKRFAEAKVVMGQLGGQDSVLANAIRSALKKAGVRVRSLTCDDKGQCSLAIYLKPKETLLPLRGFTVSELTIHREGHWRSNLDLSPLAGMPLKELNISAQMVSDLGPLQGLPLERLSLRSNPIKDLTPLRGMKLTHLNLCETQITDLSSLRGMPLKSLNIHSCDLLEDISPLRGLPLEQIQLGRDRVRRATPVKDFTPLADLPLKYLDLSENPHVTTLDIFKKCPLETVNLNDCKNVTDFSLLVEKPITALYLNNTQVTTLIPFKKLKLRVLHVEGTKIGDLRPLAGMPLTSVNVSGTKVKHIGPLAGMKLTTLNISNTQVGDIRMLKGMPLTTLQILDTLVSDLRPLEGLSLRSLNLSNTRVRDLAPVAKMSIRYFKFTPSKGLKNVTALRKTRWLRQINGKDTGAFWKSYMGK